MQRPNPYDHAQLAAQVVRQRKYAFDLETDLPWDQPIDFSKFLLPMDADAIAFPGASSEQRLVLSQLMGLIINSTISEMENAINILRDEAWAKVLRRFPINPEMWDLGELFFAEENKHAQLFERFNTTFCQQMGLDFEQVDRLLPKAYGSWFLRATRANARSGGNAFWWIVASVEEVSLHVYKQIQKTKEGVDTLFYKVHYRHMEEEARHHNYPFLMLELLAQGNAGVFTKMKRKTDLLFGQVFTTGWILAELHKVFEVKSMRREHPFFEALAGCLPLFNKMSYTELAKRLFVSAPYVGLVLNTRNHRKTHQLARSFGLLSIPFPQPIATPTFTHEHSA